MLQTAPATQKKWRPDEPDEDTARFFDMLRDLVAGKEHRARVPVPAAVFDRYWNLLSVHQRFEDPKLDKKNLLFMHQCLVREDT